MHISFLLQFFPRMQAVAWLLAAVILSGPFVATVSAEEEPKLRVMTFNVRFGTAQDGEDSWPKRKDMFMDVIRDFGPDVLGTQEGLRFQIDEMAEEFPDLVAIGGGRDEEGSNEYSSILVDRNRFDVTHAETFWLSDTPDEPASTSWGNQLPRICVMVRLLDKKTGERFLVANTHWDHQSQEAREKGATLMVERIKESRRGDEPVIVMGDFNAGEENPAYLTLLEMNLRDSFRDVHPDAEEVGTFHAFRGRTTGQKIDGILVTDNWETLDANIDHTNRDGRYPSDHFPVTAVLRLKTD